MSPDVNPAERRRLVVEHLDANLARLEHADDELRRDEALERVLELAGRARATGVVLPLVHLEHRFGLSDLELDLLLYAARGQLRAEAVAEPAPTLASFLLRHGGDPLARLMLGALVGPAATLRRLRLLALVASNPAQRDLLLTHVLVVPPRVASFLAGRLELGPALSPVARVERPEAASPAAAEVSDVVAALRDQLVRWHAGARRGAAWVLSGDSGSGKSHTARLLAAQLDRVLLEVDGALLATLEPRTAVWAVEELVGAALLFDALLVIDDTDALAARAPATRALARALETLPVATLLLSQSALGADHVLATRAVRHVALGLVPERLRARRWALHLGAAGLGQPAADDLQVLASQFELHEAQIANAVRDAQLAGGEGGEGGTGGKGGTGGSTASVEAAAFRQLRGDLSGLARARETRLTLADLVLPETEKETVREIVRAARQRVALLHRWGARERYDYGTGIVCLFSGEPGTGKTLAARIIAAELGQALFQVAIPQVVSKWVGETEKQIARIFHEARAARAVLLFDEADSLLGARTEVRTASDRYANMSTNFLLQEIEAFEGLVILTTNLQQNLDAAAERRILFHLPFPFPDEAGRAELWRRLLPPRARVEGVLDFEALAEHFELSGGHIKNAILRAAYAALDEGRPLTLDDLMGSGEREARTLGRLVRSSGSFDPTV